LRRTPLGRQVRLTSVVLASLRPREWTKNVLLFAGLVFGRRLFDRPSIARAAIAFVVFCVLSAAVYVLNDLADRDQDRNHPVKRHRPIASDLLSVGAATVIGSALGIGGLTGAALLGWPFFAIAAAYVGMSALYSTYLKHVVFVDVLVIAIGFVLRAAAGAIAVRVDISHWLLVCTFLLAVFLALAKRRQELVVLADGAALHRTTLGAYEPHLLDQLMTISAAAALTAYIFYSINPETELRFVTRWLWLTIPLPVYGVFRYLYLVHRCDGGGPADVLLADYPLLLCVGLWGLSAVCIVYHLL
jgi:4-hydroxybenzoate polyprenyltransferase